MGTHKPQVQSIRERAAAVRGAKTVGSPRQVRSADKPATQTAAPVVTASLPPYPKSLTIDCGVLVVTVYGQPSREDSEYMAAMMVEMVGRLANCEKP